MPKVDVFLDSSALIAGIISGQGAARALLLLGEDEKIILTVSEQVIAEVERNVARKVPKALPFVREIILSANIRILRDPPNEEVQKHQDWIGHIADVPILVSARQANVDFLATLNPRHFLNDPEVAKRSGLRIGTPGDVLAWVREQLTVRESLTRDIG
ncbi:MAG: PIN domain-containing protein [Chloroflexi bacterium]|nr:PIN domain-containing protein [Chloroflexota bacterium]